MPKNKAAEPCVKLGMVVWLNDYGSTMTRIAGSTPALRTFFTTYLERHYEWTGYFLQQTRT